MHKLGQYSENRHINQEQMRNDADLICTQQIPSSIILPTITTHSLSQSSYLVSVFFYSHRETAFPNKIQIYVKSMNTKVSKVYVYKAVFFGGSDEVNQCLRNFPVL